jgi:hypothetical protein
VRKDTKIAALLVNGLDRKKKMKALYNHCEGNITSDGSAVYGISYNFEFISWIDAIPAYAILFRT